MSPMFPVREWIENAQRVLEEQGDSPFEPVELQPGGHVRLGRSLLGTVYVAAGYDPPDELREAARKVCEALGVPFRISGTGR